MNAEGFRADLLGGVKKKGKLELIPVSNEMRINIENYKKTT